MYADRTLALNKSNYLQSLYNLEITTTKKPKSYTRIKLDSIPKKKENTSNFKLLTDNWNATSITNASTP